MDMVVNKMKQHTIPLGSIHSCLPNCKHSILEMCNVLMTKAYDIEKAYTIKLQESSFCKCSSNECLMHIDLSKLGDLQ